MTIGRSNEPVFSEPTIPRFIKPIQRPQIVPLPEEVEEVEEVEEEAEPGAVDDVSDVVSVSAEDVMGKPEDNLDPDEDLSDLFDVSTEDIMGPAPEPRQPQSKPKFRRVIRRSPPPGGILGIR